MAATALMTLRTCARCLRANRPRNRPVPFRPATGASSRWFADAATQRQDDTDGQEREERQQAALKDEEEEGAFTRRMRLMSEEALESGGHGVRKAVEEAGFNADLKAQLEKRIVAASLQSPEVNLPASASRHTRDLATSEAWTGTESVHDASLRMLNDAHKPLRIGKRTAPGPAVQMPQNIDTGRSRSKRGHGLRLANARDRTNVYASVQSDDSLEETERQRRLRALKERFEPGARAIVPGSIQGLASLANKRIEDAIARGQFKNIPRGKGRNVERDHNANSPFIDTTEYFMNKIIQRQEIVPPWIEKQQELTSAASKFRSRLRADWKRHAARMIAAAGGSLQDQVRRAEAYACAEQIVNPSKTMKETLTTVDKEGQISQISLSVEVKRYSSDPTGSTLASQITAEKAPLDSGTEIKSAATTTHTIEVPLPDPLANAATAGAAAAQTVATLDSAASAAFPAPTTVFRDPLWLSNETSYLSAAVADLNSKARSYNLQAPELARKPYFNLERELRSCYSDVAPLLAEAVLERARKPIRKANESFGQQLSERGIMGTLGGVPARIRDERTTKQYGFKQFWNELFTPKGKDPWA
ncbi:uncharacterized protein M421DRAFT_99290 [Didymella exigua CBS 183.55]|uniref:DnaJ homologue subfamily C member 28 conserved domain-containing protein n=1 Tax=Didymella exigua CBS 183.55 TaxID=1150837 RepID=A0A6A5RWA2_9PLEO|nr:uncharacterized protein M421DRAFT_99290 [Didymella exigua CBS 183.55]KAF1931464.1 hypothetical protein M421DRAFT_99290 [Didymella exigua CBS 183.55]